MKKVRLPKGLVKQSLEHVSKEIFSKYSDLITDLVEGSSGVYALYNEGELYYVGRATDLRIRVKQHLKDRHQAGWTHFSLYLVKKTEHVGEMESLLIRIANPKGNRVKPKGKDSKELRKKLEIAIKQRHREELGLLLSMKVKSKKERGSFSRIMKGLVDKRTSIYKEYKGKEYRAILTPGGYIIYKNKNYWSATAAAKAIVKEKGVNGWHFWFIKDKKGEWVMLRDYRA